MSKKIFWPITLVTMGLIFMSAYLNLLPVAFANILPLILVVVGLGGLLTADQDEWLSHSSKKLATKKTASPKKSSKKKSSGKKATSAKKTRRSTSRKKK